MILGDPEVFGIKVELDDDFGGEWLLGRICYLIEGKEVGNYKLGTSLRDVLIQSIYIRGYMGKREGCSIFDLEGDILFDGINSDIYMGENKLELVESIRYCVAIPVDVFDGVRVFIVACKNKEKLIYKRNGDEGVACLLMDAGFFDEVFFQLIVYLEGLMEMNA